MERSRADGGRRRALLRRGVTRGAVVRDSVSPDATAPGAVVPGAVARGRGFVVGVAALAVTLTTLLAAPASYADPDVTDDDVRAAQEAVAGAAGRIAALEVELAAQTAAVDAAWEKVAAAGEAYTQALVDQQVAADAAERAEANEVAARQELEKARDVLGTIAMQAYRSGGGLDTLGALLSADGYEDLVRRSAVIERLGTHTENAVQRFDAAELVARTMGERAREARAEADAATERAAGTLAGAERLQADAEATAARTAAQRDDLIVELAALRQTSVEVERARQAQLDAERAARAEAAAAAERGVTAPESSSPPSGPPPTTDPGSTAPPQTTPPPTNQPTPPPDTTGPPETTPPPEPSPTTPPSSDPYGLGTGSQRGSAAQGEAAVAWALAQVGKPYQWGGSGPNAFDCSGLTSQAWRAAGVPINRTSRDQYRQVRKITYDSMRPGDLIFYGSVGSDPGSITHVAMYIGNGQVVEAPRPGLTVRVTPVRWSGTMPFAGRP